MPEDITPDEQADAVVQERITSLVKRWPSAIDEASEGVTAALAILGELMNCDAGTWDSAAGGEAERVLTEAQWKLHRVAGLAADRLKLVEDAEKDAELIRLRAEVASLRQSLDSARGTGA